MTISLLRVAALSIILASLGCDDEPDHHPRTEGVLALQGDAAAGQSVFTGTCGTTVCHGADGNTPGTPQTAKLGDEVPGNPDSFLADIILKGDGPMPPQDQLTDQEIADVIAHLRVLFGE
ncbi:MAG: cytochrome c [Deltaproteobacteria bacterium]|nr:cytochrome c [Nannocystaceae bacterium]